MSTETTTTPATPDSDEPRAGAAPDDTSTAVETTAGAADGAQRPDKARTGDLRRATRLFRRFHGGRRVYVVGFALLVLEAATAVIEPLPLAYLVDFLEGAKPALRDAGLPQFLESPRTETILLLTLAVVAIAAVNSAADSFAEVCMARGGRGLGYRVRVALYDHLQRLPLAYHDKKRTGDVLTRVTGDVLVVEEFVVLSVSNILGSVLVLVGSFGFLLWQSWSIALVALIVVPVLAVVSNHFSRRIKSASKEQRSKEGELASTAQEMLTSIRLVQSYGRGTVDLEKFSDQTQQSMQASMWAANIQAKFSFVIAMVEALAISAVVWLGVWLVDREAITIGTLVLFVLLLQNMFKPSRKIVSEWYKIGKVFASVDRIDDLLERDVVVQDEPGAVEAPPLTGRLTFRHVSFRYPAEHEDGTTAAGRPTVLHDIDFETRPGEVVALVGTSGAGKSTIAQLVPRLYDPDEGEITVDGLPLRSLTLASLRNQVSLVLQETVLLSGSVAENIRYGVPDATDDDVVHAARLANADGFIQAMPEGYDTPLGERGSTLSGGQRQRLAIARAFIRKAPILILDEPTTGLDPESTQVVVAALRHLMQGRTTLLVSHDTGLIRQADRALLIADGCIQEAGTPEQVLRSTHQRLAPQNDDETSAQVIARSRPELSRPEPKKPDPSRADRRGADQREADERVADERRTSRSALAGELAQAFNGLDLALDRHAMTTAIEEQLGRGLPEVQAARPGKFWVRDDGTCSVRYQVSLGHGSGTSQALVLGRLLGDARQASAFTRRVRKTPGVRSRRLPLSPWSAPAGTVADSGLVLYPFPIDPDLPTLGAALDPGLWCRLPQPLRDEPTGYDVVHYPRHGACVVRYHLRPGVATGQERTGVPRLPRTLYGKVYPREGGRVVHSLHTRLYARLGRDLTGVRLPRPVAYAHRQRLLLSEPLPGLPLIAEIVKATREDGRYAVVHSDTLRTALRASGEALAALHGLDLDGVPAWTANNELGRLQAELAVVARYWPEVARELRDDIGRLTPPSRTQPAVLCHGDFTPSQVLLVAGQPGILDLETLCHADPALDLGRFVSQLHLLTAKVGDPSLAAIVSELSEVFVEAYVVARNGDVGTGLRERITFYGATTLARSATHACRQLKDERLALARSLLDPIVRPRDRR